MRENRKKINRRKLVIIALNEKEDTS